MSRIRDTRTDHLRAVDSEEVKQARWKVAIFVVLVIAGLCLAAYYIINGGHIDHQAVKCMVGCFQPARALSIH